MASDIHCRHWSRPFVGDSREHTCALGINIRKKVGGPDFGWGTRMPCIHGHFHKPAEAVTCDKREPYTAEEIAAHEAEMMRAMNAFAEGRSPCCGESLIEQSTSRFCSKCKEWVARVCGPSSATCKCRCPDGPCEHEWNGEVEEGSMGGGATYSSSTCSRCGMSAMSHSLRVGP